VVEGLATLAGAVLAVWAAGRLLGALARLVEAVILGALAAWLLSGQLGGGQRSLVDLWNALAMTAESAWWKLLEIAGRWLAGSR
jgi:hypothetical protein